MSADVVIIGAGAAGMMCAIEAGKRGRNVVLLDHAEKLGEKIRISGGGRCNFTNIDTRPENFLSANPDFCRSALARYTPRDFIALVEKHGIAWHEKKLGQLFCDGSAQQIIDMLKAECDNANVQWCMPAKVSSVEKRERFLVTHQSWQIRLPIAGHRQRRIVDSADRCESLRLSHRGAVRPQGHGAAPGAGRTHVRSGHFGAVRRPLRNFRRRGRELQRHAASAKTCW